MLHLATAWLSYRPFTVLELGYVALVIAGFAAAAFGIRDDRPGAMIGGFFIAGVSLVLLASATGFIK
jgi:hypothetical protein